MKVVFASLPAYGHLYPMMPLALACAEAGHDVAIATGSPFLDALPIRTVKGIVDGWTLDDTENEVHRRHPHVERLEFGLSLFAEVSTELVLEALEPTLEAEAPDLVVFEAMTSGAGIAAALLGIPAIPFCVTQYDPVVPMILQRAAQLQAPAFASRGVAAPESVADLAPALIDPLPPSWRVPPGTYQGPRLSIRPTPWSQSSGLIPDWLSAPRSRPLVYLTLGTVVFERVDVLRRAALEASSCDVDVLLVVGPKGDPTLLGELPGNVFVERFVAQDAVLPHADVAIHHGGMGTLLGCFGAAIPQVLLPQGADQFFNAERLQQTGGGLVLHGHWPDGAIAAAVTDLLADGPHREAARRFRAEIAALPTPREVADGLALFARR